MSIQIERVIEVVDILRETFPGNKIEFTKDGIIHVYDGLSLQDFRMQMFFVRRNSKDLRHIAIDIFKKKKYIILLFNEETIKIPIDRDGVTDYSIFKESLKTIHKTFWEDNRTYSEYLNYYRTIIGFIKSYKNFDIAITDTEINVIHKDHVYRATYTEELFNNGTKFRVVMNKMIKMEDKLHLLVQRSESTKNITESPLRLLAMYGFTDYTTLTNKNGDSIQISVLGATTNYSIQVKYKRGKDRYNRSIYPMNNPKESFDAILKYIGKASTEIEKDDYVLEKIIISLLHLDGSIKQFNELENSHYKTVDNLGVTIESPVLFNHFVQYLYHVPKKNK